jgi:hypothetical protein
METDFKMSLPGNSLSSQPELGDYAGGCGEATISPNRIKFQESAPSSMQWSMEVVTEQ